MVTSEQADTGRERGVNPYSTEAAADPRALYERLREEPVYTFMGVTHFISRYDDVRDALHQPEIFSSGMDSIWIGQRRPMIPLQIDPPEHGRYRRLLDPLLSAAVVAPMASTIERLVDGHIDALAGREQVDFHHEMSVPVASTVFLTLLGLPVERAPEFIGWKDAIIRPGTTAREVAGSHDKREQAAEAIYSCFTEEAENRRREPRDDWLTHVVNAEVDGEPLTEEEIQDICFLLLLGGLDTTTAALDCSILHLATHPENRAPFLGSPAEVDRAVEELLRFETPVMQVPRVVTEACTFGGHDFHAGDRVLVVLGAANTDESVFPDADQADVGRTANRHLAFGAGPHRCLGMHLARLEMQITLMRWHQRVSEYSIDGPMPDVTPVIREIPHLPLRIGEVEPA